MQKESNNILDVYQTFTPTTAVYPRANTGDIQELLYLVAGLSGEAGEVAEKIKKNYRDNHFDLDNFEKELGDVMWYLSQLANATGLSLSSILIKNRDKLIDRQNRDVIQGSGDDR